MKHEDLKVGDFVMVVGGLEKYHGQVVPVLTPVYVDGDGDVVLDVTLVDGVWSSYSLDNIASVEEGTLVMATRGHLCA